MGLTLTDKVHENRLQILGKLAASLTHEIKNPLSVLKLNLDYLKLSKEKFDEETIECIDSSLEAAEIINQLVYNTLEISRRNKNSFDDHNLNAIIEKALNITKGLASKKGITFELNLDQSIDSIKVNETNILQVFVNLISNGIEASQQNSRIKINTLQTGAKILAEVIDEGVGINEEDMDKIFDEFYTNKENGTGLGLSVCKTILDEHNAKITVNNKSEKGTQFKIEFDS